MTSPASTTDECIRALVELRYLVVRIGEVAGWWPTKCFRPEAKRSLAILFPRSADRAAFESVAQVAAADHDEKVGEHRYHLFRMSPELESHAEDEVVRMFGSAHAAPLLALDDGAVRDRLRQVAADGVPAAGCADGAPRTLGAIPRKLTAGVIKMLAACYLAGVSSAKCPHPYYEGVRRHGNDRH